MPRVDAADRALRDAYVLRLFLSGWSLREIGRHPKVQLSKRGVELAIRRQLDLDSPHRRVLAEEARNVYVLRTELLLRAAMPKALDPTHPQQLKAWEFCRRLLEQQATIASHTQRAGPPTSTI
jgi:hypothetical protein